MNSEKFDRSFSLVASQFLFSMVRPGVWVRLIDESIGVIEWQKSSDRSSYAINCGMHYTFLPLVSGSAFGGIESLNSLDCELRWRVARAPNSCDGWWSNSDGEIADSVAAVLRDKIMNQTLFLPQNMASAVSIDEVEVGDGVLKGMTIVRACLLMARLHEYLGNRQAASQFSSIGIRRAGLAVGPKVALREIYNRCST